MSAMKFNYREIVRCSNLRRENIIIIIPSNSRETSRSINGMVELEFLYKTNLQMTYLKKNIRKFSPTTALPSPLSVVPTPGPHPDTLIGAGSRVSHLLAAGCWLTHQLWSMIQREQLMRTHCLWLGWDRFLKINFYCKWQSRTAAAAVRLGWVGVGGVVLSIGVSPRPY